MARGYYISETQIIEQLHYHDNVAVLIENLPYDWQFERIEGIAIMINTLIKNDKREVRQRLRSEVEEIVNKWSEENGLLCRFPYWDPQYHDTVFFFIKKPTDL